MKNIVDVLERKRRMGPNDVRIQRIDPGGLATHPLERRKPHPGEERLVHQTVYCADMI